MCELRSGIRKEEEGRKEKESNEDERPARQPKGGISRLQIVLCGMAHWTWWGVVSHRIFPQRSNAAFASLNHES